MTDADDRPAVVVGVSPTSGSPAALRWAADEAALRGARLLAVSAWRSPRAPISTAGRPPVVGSDRGGAESEARERLAGQVAAALGEREAEQRVMHGSTFRVLLQASETAALLVLDAPARASFPEAPLLAHRLVYAAECPVVVMPPATLA